MMEVLELVTPPPVQMSSSPASFMRSSYSPSGNGNTRSNFCRSTQNCASPGLSPVSLPISYIVTTTTLTGMGAARAGNAAPQRLRLSAARRARIGRFAGLVFTGISLGAASTSPIGRLARVPTRRKEGFVHGLIRQDLLAREPLDFVRKHQPMIGRTDIEVRNQIASIAGRL